MWITFNIYTVYNCHNDSGVLKIIFLVLKFLGHKIVQFERYFTL